MTADHDVKSVDTNRFTRSAQRALVNQLALKPLLGFDTPGALLAAVESARLEQGRARAERAAKLKAKQRAERHAMSDFNQALVRIRADQERLFECAAKLVSVRNTA